MAQQEDRGFLARCFGSSPRERQAGAWLSRVCLVYALTFVGSTYALKHELVGAPVSWLVAAAPAAAAAAVLLVFVRYLRELDELQRRIQLGALAFALGAAWVAISAYPLLGLTGAPPMAGPALCIAVMALAYCLGIVVAGVRYR
jgi:hypothetical protein